MRHLLVMVCLCCTSVVMAHDTFLLPDRAVVPPKSSMQLNLTSGMTFPTLESAIEPDRVQTARYRLAGRTVMIAMPTREKQALAFRTELTGPGLATFWVQLAPKTLELESKMIGEYMDEIGASPELRSRALATVGKQRWRERYTKHAKTFVIVGDANADPSWAEPVGMALEIVPQINPALLRAGERLPLRVMRQGRPFPAFRIGIVGEGNTSIDFATTDAKGEAAFTIPRAGKWLLRGTDLRPVTRPDLEWESDFTTLTFEVR